MRRINEQKLEYQVESSSDGHIWNTGIGFVQELNAVPLLEGNGDLETVRVLIMPCAPTPDNRMPATLARVRVSAGGRQ